MSNTKEQNDTLATRIDVHLLIEKLFKCLYELSSGMDQLKLLAACEEAGFDLKREGEKLHG